MTFGDLRAIAKPLKRSARGMIHADSSRIDKKRGASHEKRTCNKLRESLAEAHRRIAELESIESRCELQRNIIREQNDFLTRVIESLPHPFYVLDANTYQITLANSVAAFGELTPDTTCYALTHRRSLPCHSTEHACPLQLVKSTKQPVVLEHIHYDRDGNPKNVEVHASPILDGDGNVVQMIEYTLDITERKRMEKELEDYAEKTKLFAYSISHDLKSPIIGISGLTRLLWKHYGSVLDEKGNLYCEQIVKASDQVLALIEEINAYIRTKESPLSIETVQSKEVLGLVRDEFAAFLTRRQIEWSEPEAIPQVRADRMSLLRVFRNLVDNALKYGGAELSEIRIGYEESEEFYTFSVSDNGVGIDEKDCNMIFGLFQRNDTAKGLEGTGLGLAIVKEIAEKHHGKTWAKSERGKGATFFISLSKAL